MNNDDIRIFSTTSKRGITKETFFEEKLYNNIMEQASINGHISIQNCLTGTIKTHPSDLSEYLEYGRRELGRRGLGQ